MQGRHWLWLAAASVVATCVACGDNIKPSEGPCADTTAVTSCGSTCTPCSAPDHSVATCDGIACGFACDVGYHACGDACAADDDVAMCGASCSPCPDAPENAHATCNLNACGFTCDPGFSPSQTSCSPTAPRLLSPLSTSTVTSRRPALRWVLAAGTDGARVELCLDRACTNVIETLDVTGSSATPDADLPVGVVFWRVRARVGNKLGSDASATWQLVVRARSAPLDRWWGSVLDVDGDGYADIAIGSPRANDNDGRVQLFPGSASGAPSTATAELTNPDGQGFFGASVASAGDVDGDGYADLIVGAPYWPGVPWAGTQAGRAYLYRGGPTGLSTSPTTLVAPDGDGSIFGFSVASAGDINGDGYGDVVVGATGTNDYVGTVYIYFGGPGGLAKVPAATIAGSAGTNARFGNAVAGVGDVDGDGYGDLVIGEPRWDAQPAGHAYLYLGSATGVAATPVTFAGPVGAGDQFGYALAADDFDGDGRADLVIGAPGVLGDTGETYVFPGQAGGFASTPTITYDFQPGSEAATSLASAGDIDGDGYADLIVGVPEFEFVPLEESIGAADVYLGSASGLGATPAFELLGAFESAFGFSVAGAGDVDGDGHADLVVGACTYGNSGAAALYLGASIVPDSPNLWWTGTEASFEAFGQAVQ
jgi:hypothetical protein